MAIQQVIWRLHTAQPPRRHHSITRPANTLQQHPISPISLPKQCYSCPIPPDPHPTQHDVYLSAVIHHHPTPAHRPHSAASTRQPFVLLPDPPNVVPAGAHACRALQGSPRQQHMASTAAAHRQGNQQCSQDAPCTATMHRAPCTKRRPGQRVSPQGRMPHADVPVRQQGESPRACTSLQGRTLHVGLAHSPGSCHCSQKPHRCGRRSGPLHSAAPAPHARTPPARAQAALTYSAALRS